MRRRRDARRFRLRRSHAHFAGSADAGAQGHRQHRRDRRRRQCRAQHRGFGREVHFCRPGRQRRGRRRAWRGTRQAAGIAPELVTDKTRPTTRKVRFVSEHHSTHLLRADWETDAPASAGSQAAIIAQAEAAIAKAGAVVLSDYAKGVLTERVIRAIIETARRLGKPVVVDPKHHDYRVYRGATLITPNAKELAAAVHRPITTEAEIAAAAAELARASRKRSGAGNAQRTWHEPACRRSCADPCAGLSGQGARRFRRGRHGRGGDGGDAGDEDALRIRHARGQCRRRSRSWQARHVDGVAR